MLYLIQFLMKFYEILENNFSKQIRFRGYFLMFQKYKKKMYTGGVKENRHYRCF